MSRPRKNLVTGSDIEISKALRQEIEKTTGRIIYTEGAFYAFSGTHWNTVPDDRLRLCAHGFDGMPWTDGLRSGVVKLNKTRISSIVHELGVMCAEPVFFDLPAVGINCANGFVRIDKAGSIAPEPHHADQRARHVAKWSWKSGGGWRNAPLLGVLLGGCFRDDADRHQRVDLIGELAGCALLGNATTLRQPKAFVFLGRSANNGKSEILNTIRALLPACVVASVPPSSFADPAMRSQLAGVALNTASELSSGNAIAAEAFKGVVTGEPMSVKRLYHDPIEFRPHALHLFATNALPSFPGGFDRGVRRRLIVLEFTRTIPADEMIPNLAQRIADEEGEALLAFAVEGATRLLRNGAFTEPDSCRQALAEWVGSDPVVAWLETHTRYDPTERTLVKRAYNAFQNWAAEEHYEPRSLPQVNNFTQRVLNHDGRFARQRSDAKRYIVGLKLGRPE